MLYTNFLYFTKFQVWHFKFFRRKTLSFTDLWITDLLNSKYEDVPTIKINSDPLYPCIEQERIS